jgi:solute carrier family 35 protein E1
MATTATFLSPLTEPVKSHMGVVLTCLLWYAVSSASSQVTKAILNEFPFPLALGECQFIIVSTLCLVTMVVINKIPQLHSLFSPGFVPPPESMVITPSNHLLITVIPLGCFQFLGKLFSHSATALVPVSTVAGVKTLSPLVLVSAYRVIYNVHFPTSTYLSLLPLVLGILLIVLADTKDTLVSTTASDRYIGIFYAGLSLFVFVAQNIYGKTVFTYNQKHVNDHAELALAQTTKKMSLPITKREEDKEFEEAKRDQSYELEVEKSHLTTFPRIRNKYDKFTLLLYCSLLGALLSLPWFLYIEAPQFLQLTAAEEDITEAHLVIIPWRLLLINGMSHFFQSLIVFHLLGAIPTVSYSIASMMKKITIIVVSMIYTGNTVTPVQFIGLLLTGVGLYSYDRWGGRS